MGEREVKVQLVGNYLRPLVKPLREHQIICGEAGSIIDGCSMLAMEDEVSFEIQKKYIFSPPYDQNIFTVGSIMNLQKNLSVRLSRDPETYRKCVRFDVGKQLDRIRNDSEYIIVFNSTMGSTLYEKDGIVFSESWPLNRFINDIKADGNYRKLLFPFPDYFNWKYYYDKFINVVLREYDSSHIILIRLNSAQWFLNKREINAFEGNSSKWRNRIEEMDEYFIEKTNCLIIDELYNYIPQQRGTCAFVYGFPGELVYAPLAREISEIIRSNEKMKHTNAIKTCNYFVKYLHYRLSSDILIAYREKIELIDKNNISFNDFCNVNKGWKKDDFLSNIVMLREFLNPVNRRTLSDCVGEVLGNRVHLGEKIDLKIVELYTRYMKLNINDIIATYMLCDCFEDKRPFRKITENILSNTDVLPVKKAVQYWNRNLTFLRDYPYIQIDLSGIVKGDALYINLGNNVYLVLDANSEYPIKKKVINAKQNIDIEQIFGKGLSCNILSADTLCTSTEFYIERAKRKLLDKPVTIYFESTENFGDSLNYINYPDLLNSEKFVIALSDNTLLPKLEKYEPVVDIDTTTCTFNFPVYLENHIAKTVTYLQMIGQLYDSVDERNSREKMLLSKKLTDSMLNNRKMLENNRFRTSIKALVAGFAIANQYLSINEGIHYFIKNIHLGDDVRGATFFALFKDYHLKNNTFPVKRIVVVTTLNNKDLMKAYKGVDEVLTFTKEELTYLQEYSGSGICIHNLYNDTFRLIKSWGTPNLCGIYKIPEEYMYRNPELLRFPAKMAEESMVNAKKFLEKNGINAEKTVVIAPYARSSGNIVPDMLRKIIDYFNGIEYTVFTNTGLGEVPLENTLPLTEAADIVFAMASMGVIMIGIQSGIMDALEWFDINIKFIFVSILDERENIRMFYNAAKLSVAPPPPHNLTQRIERRKGAVSIGISTEEERESFANDVITLSKVYIKGNLQSNICPVPDRQSLYAQINLNDYIAEAVKLPDIVLFISVCDSADRYWNAFESRHLLGLKKDLSEVWRLSYLAVIDSGNDICIELMSDKWNGVNSHYSFNDLVNSEDAMEIYSNEIKEKYGDMPVNNHCWIYSCAMDKCKYTKSSIVINGIDYSLNRRGLNIVLYSKRHARVIDSVTVDTFADATLSVKRM